tara:strand:- start:114 stop:467 length:354 start_codon:yes stop_codon:yes gene_type:complete
MLPPEIASNNAYYTRQRHLQQRNHTLVWRSMLTQSDVIITNNDDGQQQENAKEIMAMIMISFACFIPLSLWQIKTMLSSTLSGASGSLTGALQQIPIAGTRRLRLHNHHAKDFCGAC